MTSVPCLETWGIQLKVKVMKSRNRPGVTQRFAGVLGSQISMTLGTWRWWGRHPHARVAFTPRKYTWYSFSLGDVSTPGQWCSRKGICHWKIQWQKRESIPSPVTGLVWPRVFQEACWNFSACDVSFSTMTDYFPKDALQYACGFQMSNV
jgi:hypothetical protein